MIAVDPSSDSGTTLPEGPTIPVGFLMREQRRRWNSGERILIEAYFERYPDWRPANEELLDLIWHEILVREGHGETSTLEEYVRRFPALADDLRLHFEVHEALSDVGIPADATDCIAANDGTSGPAPTTAAAISWAEEAPAERYFAYAEIARGGMGTVLRARDRKIQREVAVKYLLDQDDASKKARFIAEAQITGQLEHPNIVPLHDLGIDAQQRLFFSMKMVKGRSLAEILEALRTNPRVAGKEWPLVRLLHGFLGVCNALAYAHSRGVIHRDVKPSNVMLGEFGEVYLMDWGLAKVATADATEPPADAATNTLATGEPRVSTGRDSDLELTRDGTIVGTLAYMSPEQALGEIARIDDRSDIYSLGAILYEILALYPHVDKTAGELALLHQVSSGIFPRPEERHPDRARAGLIPRELSAVAMKALARSRGDRYQSVVELRRDIERYQEGRSVSAKEYSVREIVWKLIKRNKAVSATVAVGMVVLTGVAIAGYILIDNARVRAERANEDFRAEKEARREQALKSIPAYLRAARLAANERSFDDALIQVNSVLEFNPDLPEAVLLKGQLLAALQRFPEATALFERYVELAPHDEMGKKLVLVCRQARLELPFYLIAVANTLREQKAYPMDDHLYQLAEKYAKTLNDLKDLYEKRLDAAWPGPGKNLVLSKDGEFYLYLSGRKDIHDLSSLRGMKLSLLNLTSCSSVEDLSPLAGMELRTLSLMGCRLIQDLTPLKDSKLVQLNLSSCTALRDLSALRHTPIQAIAMRDCPQVQDLSVFGVMKLHTLDVSGCENVWNLEPLRGMPLTKLDLTHCKNVEDLRPLQGMKLQILDLAFCDRVRDLKPLQGMPFVHLNLWATAVDDLSPLAGSEKLSLLDLSQCRNLKNLTPLKGAPIKSLTLDSCPVTDLGPLRGMPLHKLSIRDCQGLRDLSPLEETKVKSIFLPNRTVPRSFAETLSRIGSLEEVKVDFSNNGHMTAAEFFTRYNNGEFAK